MASFFQRRLALLLLLAVHLPGPANASVGVPLKVPLPDSAAVQRGISPESLVRLGEHLYFSATDDLHGRELWVSDGTTAGTHLVADLCPGRCSSNVRNLETVNGKVHFIASDGYGWLLYSLAGEDLAVVARLPGQPGDTEVFAGKLYVAVQGRLTDQFLFETQGTAASWRLVEDLCTEEGPPFCNRPELFVHQNALFYSRQGALRKLSPAGEITTVRELSLADDFAPLSENLFLFRGCGDGLPSPCVLMRSDGTGPGTLPVLTTPDGSTDYPNNLISWNGSVYFYGNGNRIHRSDGTASGTGPTQIPGPNDSIVATDTNKLFYRSRTEEGATELFALFTDGHLEHLLTGEASQLHLGSVGSRHLFALANQRFFWTDGTYAGSRMFEGWTDTGFRSFSELGGALYIAANRDGSYSGDLWRFDGSGNATLVLGAQEFHGGEGPQAQALGGRALVVSNVPEDGRLHRVDPGTLSTTPVADEPLIAGPVSGDVLLTWRSGYEAIQAVTPESIEDLGLSNYREFVSAGNGLFYFSNGTPGQPMWQTDGTAAGTRELFDLNPGWNPGGCSRHCPPKYPISITVSGDNLFFVAAAEPGSENIALHVYERSTGARRVLGAILPYGEMGMVPFGGNKVAFFRDGPNEEERGIWVSDGTVGGTRRILAMSLTETLDPLRFLSPVGERVVLASGSTFFPSRLRASDTQPNGTHTLLSGDPLVLGPSVAVGDQLFFVASTLEEGTELWLTDGTPAGTRAIDIRPGPASSLPNFLTRVGDRVVFAADDGVRGYEVFLSDGTAAGTFPLTDLAAGKTPSSPGSFAAVGERIFFTANDGQSGRALWALDLPPAGLSPCPAEKLCLQGGRFEVAVQAQVGTSPFVGRRAQASTESGVFTFFSANNWELMVKVLDGCALNQSYWVYAAAATDVAYELTVTDRASGERKIYQSPAGTSQPILDSAAFATCALAAPERAYTPILPLATASPRCAEELGAFCFGQGERFKAKVTWTTGEQQGVGHAEPYGSQDAGIFSFFSPANWELMLKVLDGCAINGKFWVYVAGSTDVGWTLTLEDRQTGQVRTYQNPLGSASPAIADGMAFSCP